MDTFRAATLQTRRDSGHSDPIRLPIHIHRSFVTCQDGSTGRDTPCGDRVIVVDPDSVRAAILADALTGAGLVPTICADYRAAAGSIAQEEADFVVFVPRLRAWWRSDLRRICDAMRANDRCPEIICVFRWCPDGPDDRMYCDELGVRGLYEF